MLLRPGSTPFAQGRLTYSDEIEEERSTGKTAIYVPVVLPIENGITVYAVVDTGTPWCIFQSDYIALLESRFLGPKMPAPPLKTSRHGTVNGYFERVAVTLPAEEGNSLELEATIYVVEGPWRAPNFLGYSGFLERFRFAVDPFSYSFYFGKD